MFCLSLFGSDTPKIKVKSNKLEFKTLLLSNDFEIPIEDKSSYKNDLIESGLEEIPDCDCHLVTAECSCGSWNFQHCYGSGCHSEWPDPIERAYLICCNKCDDCLVGDGGV